MRGCGAPWGGSFSGGFPCFIGLYITCLASSSTIPRLLRAPQTKPKHNPPPASPIDPMVWAQPHIPHVHTYTEAERIPVISTQNKTKTKAARRPSDPFLQKTKNRSKTSHQTSLKASRTFRHLPLKRRSIQATARSSPYPPRGSDTVRHSGPADPRCVRARGK
jgi:hypothetical protein